MATYTCGKCGFGVNLTCAACDKALDLQTKTRDDGSTVQISKCPNGHGVTKSPQCCGQDMTCPI